MPSKILQAEVRANGYYFRVHLDTGRLNEEAAPHPDWVREWTWGNLTPGVHTQYGEDMTLDQYHDSIEAMLKENISQELALLNVNDSTPVLLDRFHGKELEL